MSPSVVLDSEVRRTDHGRALVGGSPLRVIRLSDSGSKALDAALGGAVSHAPAQQKLLQRLLDIGMLHPVPSIATLEIEHVAIVIPHYNDNESLARLLEALPSGLASITVVDDGSDQLPAVGPGVGLLSHDISLGPAAARNTGWQSTSADVVCFVDADASPQPGWLGTLLGHLNDPGVAAVAPRVTSAPGTSLLDTYERSRSPLDLGDRAAGVRPRSRISYVPSATLLVRRSVLDQLYGFAESMRTGEDVDLVWRIHQAGWTVRYEPTAEVHHAPRSTWSSWLRQRHGYGQSAATLAQRHPEAITPFEASPYSAAAWAVAAFAGVKGIVTGAVCAAASTAALVPKLRGRVPEPEREAVRLAGKGTLHVGMLAAQATRRAWLPLALGAASVSPRARRVLATAVVVPSLVEWQQDRPDINPVTWTALRLADDAAYCSGVWRGMAKAKSLAAIRPRFQGLSQLLPQNRQPM